MRVPSVFFAILSKNNRLNFRKGIDFFEGICYNLKVSGEMAELV